MISCIYPEAFIARHCAAPGHRLELPTTADIAKGGAGNCGLGVFAKRPFLRGERLRFLAEPTGALLQHTLQRSPGDNLHDPYFVGFLLHSCDPNVVLDMHQQTVHVLKDILVGGALCMDYASTEDTLFNQFPCACGAANCRVWVTGRSEPVSEAGRAYISAFGERPGLAAINGHAPAHDAGTAAL